MARNLLVATRTFITYVDGKRVVVTKGKTRVREGHELTKGRAHLFAPADAQYDDVEDTLARPGRKRGTPAATSGSAPAARKPARRTAKKAAAKKAAAKTPAKKAADKPASSEKS